MGKASVSYMELRFVIEPELTQVYVLCEAKGDCPIGVQWWHHKAFPASKPTMSIMEDMFLKGDDPVLWPLNAPKGNHD